MDPLTMGLLVAGFQLAKHFFTHLDSVIETIQLSWNTVYGWLVSKKSNSSDVGKLIQKGMTDGKYRVVCGIFSGNGQALEQVAWDCSEMDYELRQRLGSKSEIRIEL